MLPHERFRAARERLGLSQDELAHRIGINAPSIWHVECFEGELTSCYSPKEVATYCRALEISPAGLFGQSGEPSGITEQRLIELIHSECRNRGMTWEQFGDVVGWDLEAAAKSADGLLGDLSVDGLQWLCQELRTDWRRVLTTL